MKKQPVNSGKIANLNGQRLEDALAMKLDTLGFRLFSSEKEYLEYTSIDFSTVDMTPENCYLLQPTFIGMFGKSKKNKDCSITIFDKNKNKQTICVELRYQNTTGSVLEKYPKTWLELYSCVNADKCFVVYEGKELTGKRGQEIFAWFNRAYLWFEENGMSFKNKDKEIKALYIDDFVTHIKSLIV